MLDYLLHAQNMNLSYAKRLLADIPDDQMAIQPHPGMNHAAWIVGHMATAADFSVTLLGEARVHDEAWSKKFGIDSKPVADRSQYPAKADLLAALEKAYARRAEILKKTPLPAKLAEPVSFERMRTVFPKTGDAVYYMTAAHDAIHLGQLSAWRRAMGMKAV